MEALSSDGTDSLDVVLVDRTEPRPFSKLKQSSESSSSGGLNRSSRGLPLKDMLNSFSETLVCCSIASTVNRCSEVPRLRLLLDFGGGIEVMARRAATEGGIASGECTSCGRRLDRVVAYFLLAWWRSFLGSFLCPDWKLSWCPRMGITTGDEAGVVEAGVVEVEFRITSVLPSYLSSLIDIEGVEAFDLAFGLANNENGVGILLACWLNFTA